MNASEIKLDLFRKIDRLNDSEVERLYNKFLTLLNTTSVYRLSDDEKKAIDEALEESHRGNTFTHEEVMNQAKSKYPNLNFK